MGHSLIDWLFQSNLHSIYLLMIYLENILLWDGELSPTRIPSISIDPIAYSALAEDEQWIICGKWKIKINVKPTQNGFALFSNDKLKSFESGSGCVFIDQNFIQFGLVDGNAVALMGSFGGCVDIRWP